MGPLRAPKCSARAIFAHFAKFLKNCSVTFFSSAAEGSSGAFQMPIRLSSSVVVVRPSTFSLNLPFLKNCSATFFLITHTASISCQLSSMKIWTPLKNSKGPLEPLKGPSRRPKMHIFAHYANFLKNCSATFSLNIHTASTSCQLSSVKIWTPLKNSKGAPGAP